MSNVALKVGDKQRLTKQTSFMVGALHSINANIEEFSFVVSVLGSQLHESRLGKEKILVIGQDSKVSKLSFADKIIEVKASWKLNYIKRLENKILLGFSQTFADSDGKMALAFESKTEIDTKSNTGVTKIKYTGLINGEEAFIVEDKSTLKHIDPSLISEQRV